MAEEHTENQKVTPATTVADDAVGLPSPQWFIAVVRSNTERRAADFLSSLGYDVYVASQPRLRILPSGRKKIVEKVIINGKIFINCSEAERRKVVGLPYIRRFLTDPAGAPQFGHRPIAVLPQSEIDKLRFMLGQSDIPVDMIEGNFNIKDKVKIIRGSLKGLEGEVIESTDGSNQIVIALDLLGYARISISSSDLQKL